MKAKKLKSLKYLWLTIMLVTSSLCNLNTLAQDTLIIPDAFETLDSANIPTGILIDRAGSISDILLYDGNNSADVLSSNTWQDLYSTILASYINSPSIPDKQELFNTMALNSSGGKYAIGILNMVYNIIKEDAFDNGLIDLENGQFYDISIPPASPYNTNRCFVAAVLNDEITEKDIRFFLDESLFVSNTGEAIASVDIDFGDGISETGLQLNDVVDVSYPSSGNKELTITAHLQGGGSLTCKSSIAIITPLKSSDVKPDNYDYRGFIDAEYNWKGEVKTARGEWSVYRACGCASGTIKKPLIYMECFDPTDTESDLNSTENDISDENKSQLSALGYDLIVVAWEHAGGPIQGNAMILRKLITEEIWPEMQQHGYNDEFVVVGASMAGLIARYALSYMEAHGEDHHAKLFISIDSPQRGAYIPLSLMDIVRGINEFNLDEILPEEYKKYTKAIYTEAGQQMSVYHEYGNDLEENKAYPSPLRTEFMDELTSFGNNGYPSKAKLAAIAWGAGNGVGQGFEPGDARLEIDENCGVIPISIHTWAPGNHTPTKVSLAMIPLVQITTKTPPFLKKLGFDFDMNYIWGPRVSDATFDNPLPYESAPGSTWTTLDFGAKFIGEDWLGGTGFGADPETLIPTVSALDIETDNLYYNVRSHFGFGEEEDYKSVYKAPYPAITLTPFQEFYVGKENLRHSTGAVKQKQIDFITELLTIPVNLNLENEMILANHPGTVHFEALQNVNFVDTTIIQNNKICARVGNCLTFDNNTAIGNNVAIDVLPLPVPYHCDPYNPCP